MKTKKYIMSLLIVLNGILGYSQEFKGRQIKKLENMGIPFEAKYSNNPQAIEDLHQVLRYNTKHKVKHTVAATIFNIGVGALIGGTLLLKEGNQSKDGFGSLFHKTGGTLVLATGAVGVGGSILIFRGARKSRKKRDKLKLLYQNQSSINTTGLETERPLEPFD